MEETELNTENDNLRTDDTATDVESSALVTTVDRSEITSPTADSELSNNEALESNLGEDNSNEETAPTD